jgi:hypothetical protein
MAASADCAIAAAENSMPAANNAASFTILSALQNLLRRGCTPLSKDSIDIL